MYIVYILNTNYYTLLYKYLRDSVISQSNYQLLTLIIMNRYLIFTNETRLKICWPAGQQFRFGKKSSRTRCAHKYISDWHTIYFFLYRLTRFRSNAFGKMAPLLSSFKHTWTSLVTNLENTWILRISVCTLTTLLRYIFTPKNQLHNKAF